MLRRGRDGAGRLDRRSFLAALAGGLALGPLRGAAAWAAPDGSSPRWSPDNGMGAFTGSDGTVRLVRNHEVDEPGAAIGPGAYDPRAGGGTTTLVFDPVQGRFLSSFVSLTGTVRNCSGGATPWGTWLSCEENVAGPAAGFDRPHGYCFEVDPAADGPREARPLRSMGRFLHEAVAVDPRTGIVYETEDRYEAGFYRFIPERLGRLRAGGRLQMLAVDGQPGYDARRGQTPGRVLPVRWVDIPRPDPPGAGPDAVYRQGLAGGGATFARLEGCCSGQGGIFFTATTGGDAGLGQVWAYEPGPAHRTRPAGSRLRLRPEDHLPRGIHRGDLVARRRLAVRQRPDPRDHLRHHRAVAPGVPVTPVPRRAAALALAVVPTRTGADSIRTKRIYGGSGRMVLC